MNTCSSCRFWKHNEEEAKRRNRGGEYWYDRETPQRSECLHPAISKSYEWPFDRESIKPGGDPQGMETGVCFGCVHHEGKP